ncbi:MAG: PepSY domain-containing protein [Lautropia sp.]
MRLIASIAAIALVVPFGAARAHGDVTCTKAPRTEWRSQDELQKKLVAEGWKIRRIAMTASCYEVYAKTPDGRRIEAFFDPATLRRVE